MRLEHCIEVNAPRQAVWDLLAEADSHPLFMAGLTRWDVQNGPAMGCGTRINMRMKVGSAQVGSLIEITEFDAPADMAWNSVTGIDQRGRWRLREAGPGRTKVTLRLAYQAPGGLLGWVVDQVGARDVRRNLRLSLDRLKEQVEAGAGHARARRAG
ncbi:MAG TPA: SRPBCC family protein [Acidimicrobiales bacterium]|nr:SRPBCC family protein [Acidimicrobiales bacterium]